MSQSPDAQRAASERTITLADLRFDQSKLLGDGGSAVAVLVYTNDGQAIAVKELKSLGPDNEALVFDLYQREVRNLALALQRNNLHCHPNVVCYRGTETGPRKFTQGYSQTAFLFTDYVSDFTLDSWAKRAEQLPTRAALFRRLLATALKGLAFLHNQADIVHRDIKSNNIAIRAPESTNPSSVLLDLGLACIGDTENDCAQLNDQSFVVVRHYYRFAMANQPQEVKRADVWALAFTFLSAAVGESSVQFVALDDNERIILTNMFPASNDIVRKTFYDQRRMQLLQSRFIEALRAARLDKATESALLFVLQQWQRPPTASETLERLRSFVV